MKRTKLDYIYLLLCFQLISICGVIGIYWLFNNRNLIEIFWAIYFTGFAIFFTVMFVKIFKKTEYTWIDTILDKWKG